MNWGTVRTVLAKELKETLRDRRTMFMMLVIPTLLYPLMMVGVEQLTLFGRRQLGERPAVVAVRGADAPALAFLAADTALRLAPADSATVEAVREGGVEAAVLFAPAAGGEGGTRSARIFYEATDDRSQRAADLASARLEAWGDTLLARRLAGAGLPATFARPLVVADTSVASAEETGGYALGRFLPVLLILMTLLGTFYPAIDLAAGEKERGTLETLLTAPVPAREIVAGKFAAVAAIGMTAAVVNLASMLLTFQSGVFRFARESGLRFTLPLDSALLVLLGLVPLAVLFAALFLGIAVRSQSFKEAQNALTPVQLASTLPVFVVSLPGIEFNALLAAVPVAGLALMFRELMAGTATLVPSLVAFGATVFYAALALHFAARAFGREEVLFGSGSGDTAGGGWRERLQAWRTSSRGVPLPAEGMAFIAVIGVLYFHFGGRLQATLGETGLLASQWGLFALPALLFAFAGPYRPRRALALRAPSGRTLLGALLIALGGMPVGWALGWAQLQYFEIPQRLVEALLRLTSAPDPSRLAWLLFVVAVTPAVCEELVFRGVFQQSLSREVPAWRTVAASALVFGVFHVSGETAIRLLPTAWLGVLLGTVVWRSRSIFASMLMHAVNNGLSVVIVSTPALGRWLLPGGSPNWALVALAPLLILAGFRLLPKRGAEPDDGTADA